MGETTRFTLTVVNNQADAEARGAVSLSAPEKWLVTPAQVPYRLSPGGQHSYELAVAIPRDEAAGTITAEVEWRGRRFFDILVVGDWQPLRCAAQRRQGRVVVTISNPNPRDVSGQVACVTTAGRWPGRVAGPWRRRFIVAAAGDTEVSFEAGEDAQEGTPVAAKVMYHRRVDYIVLGE
jgi:hypothetical protein